MSFLFSTRKGQAESCGSAFSLSATYCYNSSRIFVIVIFNYTYLNPLRHPSLDLHGPSGENGIYDIGDCIWTGFCLHASSASTSEDVASE